MAKTARRVVEPVGGRMSVKAGNPVDKYVGSRVRMRRMLLGISQEELGHHAGGISSQQIQKYEKGANRIAVSRMHQIAQALGVPVGFFYEGAPMLDGKGDYQITEVTGFADFLATSLSLEMMQAFGELKSEKLKRRILQLTRTIADAGTEGDPPRAQPISPPSTAIACFAPPASSRRSTAGRSSWRPTTRSRTTLRRPRTTSAWRCARSAISAGRLRRLSSGTAVMRLWRRAAITYNPKGVVGARPLHACAPHGTASRPPGVRQPLTR